MTQIQGSAIADKTRATRCSTANMQVDTQCDKLATELSRQCFASKVTNFQLPQLHLAPPLGVTPFEFCWDFQQQ